MNPLGETDPLAYLRAPRRSLRAPFMLTPLIDVLFLLLIFFMLSSNISPFAMLNVSAAQQGSQAPDPAPAAAAATARTILVQVSNGSLRIDGREVAPDEVAPALADLLADGDASLVVLLGRDATVQDTVSLLDRAAALPFAGVQVVSGRSAP